MGPGNENENISNLRTTLVVAIFSLLTFCSFVEQPSSCFKEREKGWHKFGNTFKQAGATAARMKRCTTEVKRVTFMSSWTILLTHLSIY